MSTINYMKVSPKLQIAWRKFVDSDPGRVTVSFASFAAGFNAALNLNLKKSKICKECENKS